ncbi:MAG: DEAD/DEAH box helicase family protein [Actinobacteria bacterium]|nr:DEAD/DEAH box helicase family protein [Actinomycetota bacterium]
MREVQCSATAAVFAGDLQQQLEQTSREVDRLRAENERLRTLLALRQRSPQIFTAAKQNSRTPTSRSSPSVATTSTPSEKIALIRSLFRGREDVYALRWENSRSGKSGYTPAVAGGWGGARDAPKLYLPLSDEAIEKHLRGCESIGIYPLLKDDSCWLLACDLDGSAWHLDAMALLEACTDTDVPAVLERSRSGSGAHLWVFFTSPVAAASARRLGALLLREAMASRAELDLASYDRLFPSQDFLPQKGFGNLIALPLQGKCREAGMSVFLDPATLEPAPDQWALLSSIERLSPEALESLLASRGDVPVGPAAITTRARSARDTRLSPVVACTIGADLAIPRASLPPPLLAELKHLASLHNPLFYERQRLRLSTHQTPRLIRCYDETLTHLQLPRGLHDQVALAIQRAGSRLAIDDRRPNHNRISLEFHGALTPLQQAALSGVLAHADGVLVAPPGTGKTVIACAVIAARGLPTLVLTHSKPLLEQWRAQLQALLDLPSKEIGQIGGGRRRLTGNVDLGMIQSLKTIDDPEAFFSSYGHVVVDECHHLPAVSFEQCVRKARARHFLGLTATPYRRDGLQEIITMQCGPIRHRIASGEGPAGDLTLELVVQETELAATAAGDTPIQEVFRALVEDKARTALVCDDVVAALDEGRRCLVLSQWTEHCHLLADGLRSRGVAPLVLEGKLGKRARAAIIQQISDALPQEQLVVVATGQYLGEGFDSPKLDALFLAFPVSFKGRLVQYTGRLMRAEEGKTTVRVHDYADTRVPVLRAMHTRRLATYKSLGFKRKQPASGAPSSQLLVPTCGA